MATDVRSESASGGVRSWLTVYAKGFAMGMADAVPGVSGGTIALITGIYERLIGAITAIDPESIVETLRALLRLDGAGAWAQLREMDLPFLLVLGSGVVTAVVTVTSIVEHAATEQPVPTFGFFFGLIAASAVVLYSEVALDTTGRKAAAAAGFLFAFVVSGQAAGALGTESLLVTFAAGAVAVSAMILPGISGSLILLILGQYVYMSETLSGFKDELLGLAVGGGTVAGALDSGTVVVTFVAGAVVGLFTISHVVRWALDRYHEATLAFLVSLIVGALRAPVVRVSRDISGAWSNGAVATFVGMALVGGLVVVLVDRYAADIEY